MIASIRRLACVTVLVVLGAPWVHGVSWSDFSSYYVGKDLLPTAVAHGGAAALNSNDFDMLALNPALGPFLRLSRSVQLSFNFAFLPDEVGFQQMSALIRLTPSRYLYLFASQVTADFDAVTASLEDQGEINARAIAVGVNTGVGWTRGDVRYAVGGTLKFLSSKSYSYTRQALALDGAFTINVPALHSRAMVAVKNVGADLLVLQQWLDPTNTVAGLTATNRSVAPLPLSLALGWMWQWRDLVQVEAGLEYAFPDPSLLSPGAGGLAALGLLDGDWRPKLGLDLIAFPNVRVSAGLYLRPNTGVVALHGGLEWDVKILDMGFTLKYAISPSPSLLPSHFLGLTLKLD